MKKIVLLLTIIMVSLSGVAQIPNKFTLNEKMISIGTCFDVSGVNGVINEKVVSMTASFKLFIDDKLVCSSRQRYFSYGSKIDIFDAKGLLVGSVEEQVFESLFSSFYTKYNIYDAKGKLIAESVKHKLMATEFTIKNVNGVDICRITRPMINVLGDEWNVTFSKTNYNKLLFVFIPCYKTYRDNRDK